MKNSLPPIGASTATVTIAYPSPLAESRKLTAMVLHSLEPSRILNPGSSSGASGSGEVLGAQPARARRQPKASARRAPLASGVAPDAAGRVRAGGIKCTVYSSGSATRPAGGTRVWPAWAIDERNGKPAWISGQGGLAPVGRHI